MVTAGSGPYGGDGTSRTIRSMLYAAPAMSAYRLVGSVPTHRDFRKPPMVFSHPMPCSMSLRQGPFVPNRPTLGDRVRDHHRCGPAAWGLCPRIVRPGARDVVAHRVDACEEGALAAWLTRARARARARARSRVLQNAFAFFSTRLVNPRDLSKAFSASLPRRPW